MNRSRKVNARPEARVNTARLVAELQAVTLALRIGGLEGLRSGAVKMGQGHE